MSRVLSYDHRPAAYKIPKKAVFLSSEIIEQYVGGYEGADKRTIIVNRRDGLLELKDGEFEIDVYPEAENLFFFKDKDLQFEFVEDDNNRIVKMIVYEGGAIVEEAKKLK